MGKKNELESMSFEERMERLQNIVNTLEQGDTALEKSLEVFKQGLAISKLCHEELVKAKHEITVLNNEKWESFEIEKDSKEL